MTLNWKENYWQRKELSVGDFKIGDTVKIIKKAESHIGWKSAWVPSMDKTIGEVGRVRNKIEDANIITVYFDWSASGSHSWNYPPFALEKVR